MGEGGNIPIRVNSLGKSRWRNPSASMGIADKAAIAASVKTGIGTWVAGEIAITTALFDR